MLRLVISGIGLCSSCMGRAAAISSLISAGHRQFLLVGSWPMTYTGSTACAFPVVVVQFPHPLLLSLHRIRSAWHKKIAGCRPLITDHRLPITDHRLPITDYRFLITDYWLLITDYWLLRLRCWLPVSHFYLLYMVIIPITIITIVILLRWYRSFTLSIDWMGNK